MHTACAAAAAAEHRAQRPDLAEHRATNAITCRVVVGGQPSGNGGEDLRRLGAVVLRACGLGEAVYIGLGDVVHPRVGEHPADRIRRGTAKQAGRVRRRRGQPDLGTDHRKLGDVWRTAKSNYGSSHYHLGATRSIEVVDAAQRPATVTSGRCRALRLLHFAAAAPRGAVLYRPRSGQRWEELSLDLMADPRSER